MKNKIMEQLHTVQLVNFIEETINQPDTNYNITELNDLAAQIDQGEESLIDDYALKVLEVLNNALDPKNVSNLLLYSVNSAIRKLSKVNIQLENLYVSMYETGEIKAIKLEDGYIISDTGSSYHLTEVHHSSLLHLLDLLQCINS